MRAVEEMAEGFIFLCLWVRLGSILSLRCIQVKLASKTIIIVIMLPQQGK